MLALAPCPDCKALVPAIDGPTHAYVGGSPGCWAIFGEVQARAYDGVPRPPIHRLLVDAYMAQHPSVPSRRAIQSVAVHLIALCCYLERGYPPHETTDVVRKAVGQPANFVWLDPPADPGLITILDIYNATDVPRETDAITAWLPSVWHSWSAHHATIRRWADNAHLIPKPKT